MASEYTHSWSAAHADIPACASAEHPALPARGLTAIPAALPPRRIAQALITMGVLVPGGDITSLKRTAQFFLNSFADRLKVQGQQRQELGDKYDTTFKGKRSKDEAKERRKQILVRRGALPSHPLSMPN